MPMILESNMQLAPHASVDWTPLNNDALLFGRGMPIAPVPPIVAVIADHVPETGYPDYFEAAGPVPIMSKRLCDWLLAQGVTNLQFAPVEFDAETMPKGGYFAVNAVGLVDAIDLETSEYVSAMRLKVFRLRKLKMRSERSDLMIYRMQHYKAVLVIDDGLAGRLVASGLTGFKLMTADGWGDSHRF